MVWKHNTWCLEPAEKIVEVPQVQMVEEIPTTSALCSIYMPNEASDLAHTPLDMLYEEVFKPEEYYQHQSHFNGFRHDGVWHEVET